MATELGRRYYYVSPIVYETRRGCYHESATCSALRCWVTPGYHEPKRLSVTQLRELLDRWAQSRCKTQPVRACKRCSGLR